MEDIFGVDTLKIVGMQSGYDVAYVKSNKASLSRPVCLGQSVSSDNFDSKKEVSAHLLCIH